MDKHDGHILFLDPSSTISRRVEQITLQMASSLDLQVALAIITQGVVDELDGAVARIWYLAGCGKTLWARRDFTGLYV